MSDNRNYSEQDLSIVIPCMGRKSNLLETLSCLNPDGAKIIVVDYSCPENCGTTVEELYPEAQVVRVEGQKHFDLSHARNAGLDVVATEWVLFLDADVIPSKGFVAKLLENINPHSFYLFRRFRNEGATGSVVVPTASARKLGGYDRRFVGYGGEDIDLFERLLMVGLEQRFIPDEPDRVIVQKPGERVAHYEEKSVLKAISISRIYGSLKRDIMAMEKRQLSNQELDTLRSKAENIVQSALEKGSKEVSISVIIKSSSKRYFPQIPNMQPAVKRQLRYLFEIRA